MINRLLDKVLPHHSNKVVNAGQKTLDYLALGTGAALGATTAFDVSIFSNVEVYVVAVPFALRVILEGGVGVVDGYRGKEPYNLSKYKLVNTTIGTTATAVGGGIAVVEIMTGAVIGWGGGEVVKYGAQLLG